MTTKVGMAFALLCLFTASTSNTGLAGERFNPFISLYARPSEQGQRLSQQTNQFGRTVMTGIGAGALTGALAGRLIGHDWRSAAKGALAGAVVGGLAGYYIAGKQQHFANQAAALEGISQDLQQQNQELGAMAQTADAMLSEDQRRVAALRLKVASAEAGQKEQSALVNQVEADNKVLSKAIDTAQARLDVTKKNVTQYEKDYGNQSGQSFDPLIATYKEQQDSLRSSQDQVASLVTELRSKS